MGSSSLAGAAVSHPAPPWHRGDHLPSASIQLVSHLNPSLSPGFKSALSQSKPWMNHFADEDLESFFPHTPFLLHFEMCNWDAAVCSGKMVQNGFKKRELLIVGSTPRSTGLCTGSLHCVPWILSHRQVQGRMQLDSGLSFVQKK